MRTSQLSACQAGACARNVARLAALRAGLRTRMQRQHHDSMAGCSTCTVLHLSKGRSYVTVRDMWHGLKGSMCLPRMILARDRLLH